MSEILADRLKHYREQSGKSQNEIADYLNITRQSVSQWERGKAYPDIENLKMLCRLYNITLDELVGGITSKSVTELSSEKEEIAVSEKKIDENAKMALEPTLEKLCLAVILVLSAQFAFLGMVIPIAVLYWMKKYERKYKLIYLLLISCFFISVQNTFLMLDYWFWDLGEGTIY